MNLSSEIAIICDILNISEEELGKKLGVTFETINNWKNNKTEIGDSYLELLYSYAYSQGIKLNLSYEQLLKEEYSNKYSVVLFHGAKRQFKLPIDIANNSKSKNNLGIGFYLGSSFEQAANYISYLDVNKVYSFRLDLKGLKVIKFEVNTEWMLAIAYCRGWIEDYKDTQMISDIIKKIENCDVVIAPIADNRMFDIINEFVENQITDEQCRHALAATNLGFQYVLKTEKAVSHAVLLKEMFVCEREKEQCTNDRKNLTNTGLQKVKMARIEYKNKGKYIEELFS